MIWKALILGFCMLLTILAVNVPELEKSEFNQEGERCPWGTAAPDSSYFERQVALFWKAVEQGRKRSVAPNACALMTDGGFCWFCDTQLNPVSPHVRQYVARYWLIFVERCSALSWQCPACLSSCFFRWQYTRSSTQNSEYKLNSYKVMKMNQATLFSSI